MKKNTLITIVVFTAFSFACYLPRLVEQLDIKNHPLIIINLIAFLLGNIAVTVIDKIRNSDL